MATSKSAPATADDYAAAQEQEWSQYVAAAAIDYFGTRAYNVGDPVPASAVEPNGWVPSSAVTKVGKDSQPYAGSGTVVSPEPPAIDPAAAAAPAVTTTEV